MLRQGCRRRWSCRASPWCTRGNYYRWTPKENSSAKGSLEAQIEQVLNNLDAVLNAAGSGLGQAGAAQRLCDRARHGGQGPRAIEQAVGPGDSADDHGGADAHAAAQGAGGGRCGGRGGGAGPGVSLQRCAAVAGDAECADAAVLPRGGIAYVSGVPAEGGLATTAIEQVDVDSLARLSSN